MSIDIGLECKCCGTYVMSQNITHNLIPMWGKAGIYSTLYNSSGLKAKDVVNDLKSGLNLMRLNPSIFRALNPYNNWGSYEGALDFLKRIIEGFERFPDCIIHVSK